jgi:hypothetical protein
MVVDDEEDDTAKELIMEDRQVLDVLEEADSIPCAKVCLGLTAYVGQRQSFLNIHKSP